MKKYFLLFFLCLHTRPIIFNQANDLFCYANHLFQTNNITQAAKVYLYLLQQFPQSFAINYNAGKALLELNKPDRALHYFNKALHTQPHNPDLHVLKAIALFSLNRWQEGWQEYEWRWQLPEKKKVAQQFPLLTKNMSVYNKRILVRSEGAFGDTFQFIRYAQELKKQGAHIILHTHPAMKKILSCCPYIDEIVCVGDPLPAINMQTSTMSLPFYFDAHIPTHPYLYADKILINHWQKKINKKKFTIGLCVHANQQNDNNRPAFARRSIEIDSLTSLFETRNITFYNLHTHPLPTSLPLISFNNIDQIHGRFMDTAAIIMNLDLIISVDTSIAHLAGGLGKPVWLLLPWKADWRWSPHSNFCKKKSLETLPYYNESMWYSTMKVFKQPKPYDWESVINQITTKLKKIMEEYEA